MGIGIAYRGKLRSPDLVPELVADMRERAQAAGWTYKEMETLVAEGIVEPRTLTGISLYLHRECEPVRLHFDAEGVFVNHFYEGLLSPGSKTAKMMLEALSGSATLMRSLSSDAQPVHKKGPHVAVAKLPSDFGSQGFLEQGRRYNWTKTQHAGPEAHVAVCELLRHVKDRYAPDLQVDDDTGYFDHGDHEKLLSQMAYADRLVSMAASAFQSVASSKTPPTSLNGLLDRVNLALDEERNKLH